MWNLTSINGFISFFNLWVSDYPDDPLPPLQSYLYFACSIRAEHIRAGLVQSRESPDFCTTLQRSILFLYSSVEAKWETFLYYLNLLVLINLNILNYIVHHTPKVKM